MFSRSTIEVGPTACAGPTPETTPYKNSAETSVSRENPPVTPSGKLSEKLSDPGTTSASARARRRAEADAWYAQTLAEAARRGAR